MQHVDVNVSNATPRVRVTIETDDPAVLSALYHRLNIGSRRLVNAKKIVSGRARGQKYGDQYGISKEDVLARGTVLETISDRLEPYVS